MGNVQGPKLEEYSHLSPFCKFNGDPVVSPLEDCDSSPCVTETTISTLLPDTDLYYHHPLRVHYPLFSFWD